MFSFPFCFSFLVFSFLISPLFHFLFIFSSPLVIFSPFLEQPLIRSKGGNFLPFFSNHLCGHQISHFIPYFLFMTSSTTWLNVSHGIPFPTHGSLWAILSSGPHGFAKCHSLRMPWGIPQPCHVSSDTPCLEKCEIPTTSEFNEIRPGS